MSEQVYNLEGVQGSIKVLDSGSARLLDCSNLSERLRVIVEDEVPDL